MSLVIKNHNAMHNLHAAAPQNKQLKKHDQQNDKNVPSQILKAWFHYIRLKCSEI